MFNSVLKRLAVEVRYDRNPGLLHFLNFLINADLLKLFTKVEIFPARIRKINHDLTFSALSKTIRQHQAVKKYKIICAPGRVLPLNC